MLDDIFSFSSFEVNTPFRLVTYGCFQGGAAGAGKGKRRNARPPDIANKLQR
jgi:hypothetical protein